MKVSCCLLISLAIFYSCKKSNGTGPVIPNGDATVYVSGYCWDTATSLTVPLYWEDSIVHFLPASDTASAYARAITYSGNQLYIAGQASYWFPTPGLWINGTQNDISSRDTSSLQDALGIYVSGTDIYLAGEGTNTGGLRNNSYAKIWKNGVTTTLNTNPGFSRAVGITVAGDLNTYVAWTGSKANGHMTAMYNRNGENFVLDSTSADAYCVGICSSGSDVYIAGNVFNSDLHKYEAVYWKNGSLVKFSDAAENTYASAIAASGNDVYISGGIAVSEMSVAKSYGVYWKNGVEHRITTGDTKADIWSIALSGSDVYTAGIENDITKYWKNDVPHTLHQDALHATYIISSMTVAQK